MKTILKFALLALLLLTILIVPLMGVSFYDSPGLLSGGSVLANMQFGGGSSVYLTFDSEDEKVNSEENLKKGAEVLENRFTARGYSDVTATVKDGQIRLDFAQKSFVESVISQVATIGKWTFVGSDMTKSLCDASYIEDAYVSANPAGGYAITMKFTEKGAEEFYANVASYAVSGSSFYLMLDDQLTAMATVSSSEVAETFTFGQYEYDSAAIIASMMKHGELPATVKIDRIESLSATLGNTLLTVILSAVCIIILACVVALVLFGRTAGIFASFGIIADCAILLTALLNGSFQLSFTTLTSMLILIILATILSVFAIKGVGKSLKEKKIVSSSALTKLGKINVKSIWIHGAVIGITLICHLFATGMFLYIARIALIFACTNIITYFIFLYFGILTLAEAKKN